MRAEPSEELIEMLERLDLASAQQVRRAGRRVARLARDLPLFESVWGDALAQARVLTAFQAAEINAGRGNRLAIGPFTVCRPLGAAGYADWFHARRRGTSETARVGIALPGSERTAEVLAAVEQLAKKSPQIPAAFAPVHETGCHEGRIWLAGSHVTGRTAAEWMVSNGRFPAEAVLEIARQMAAALAVLEPLGVSHGDIGTAAVLLTPRGDVVMPQPGVRAILRPEEGFGTADLLPQAYDYLAPERIEEGSRTTASSEIYACGCLWWHLLTGRPPFAGGNALIKLQSIQRAEIPDLRSWVPDVPAPLFRAIAAAVQRDPAARPGSMARLADMLGPPTKQGRILLRRCLTRSLHEPIAWAVPVRVVRRWQHQAIWLSMAGGCLIAAATIGWTWWRGLSPEATAGRPQPLPVAETLLPTSEATAEPSGAGRGPVQLTSHQSEPPATDRDLLPRDGARSDDLVLPSNGPLAIDPRQIHPGQTIRGEPGKRPMVVVPESGMLLAAENARFENIDFVGESSGATKSQEAIIHLQASRAEFCGCSFQSAQPAATLPAAILWTHPLDPGEAERSLPSGEVFMTDCVFRNVAAGVVLRTRAALAITFDNVLYLGSGAMLAVGRYPSVDEPLVLRMTGVSLRDSGPLIQCSANIDRQPGTISILTDNCAFAPADQAALVSLAARELPADLLKTIRWTGQGSLISPLATVAGWQTPEGQWHPLDDASLSIAGLVRSEMQFAGPREAGPTANRMVRWQAPLQSAGEPGIECERFINRGIRHWVGLSPPTY